MDTETTVDVAAARSRADELRAELEAEQIRIAEQELTQAEAAHGELYRQCVEAQTAYDDLDSQVNARQHVFYQASTRRTGAKQQIDMILANRPDRMRRFDQSHPYSTDRNQESEWKASLERAQQEQQDAEREYGDVGSELVRLQSERRAAAKVLEGVSWQEGAARERVTACGRTLAAMKPTPAGSSPWQEPRLNGATLVLTTGGGIPSDPRTRRPAAR